uniref:ORF22 n=1 Tax=Latid herpesvirus 1 TaxID=3096545 RepID=A0AB33V6L3_9VIRU
MGSRRPSRVHPRVRGAAPGGLRDGLPPLVRGRGPLGDPTRAPDPDSGRGSQRPDRHRRSGNRNSDYFRSRGIYFSASLSDDDRALRGAVPRTRTPLEVIAANLFGGPGAHRGRGGGRLPHPPGLGRVSSPPALVGRAGEIPGFQRDGGEPRPQRGEALRGRAGRHRRALRAPSVRAQGTLTSPRSLPELSEMAAPGPRPAIAPSPEVPRDTAQLLERMEDAFRGIRHMWMVYETNKTIPPLEAMSQEITRFLRSLFITIRQMSENGYLATTEINAGDITRLGTVNSIKELLGITAEDINLLNEIDDVLKGLSRALSLEVLTPGSVEDEVRVIRTVHTNLAVELRGVSETLEAHDLERLRALCANEHVGLRNLFFPGSISPSTFETTWDALPQPRHVVITTGPTVLFLNGMKDLFGLMGRDMPGDSAAALLGFGDRLNGLLATTEKRRDDIGTRLRKDVDAFNSGGGKVEPSSLIALKEALSRTPTPPGHHAINPRAIKDFTDRVGLVGSVGLVPHGELTNEVTAVAHIRHSAQAIKDVTAMLAGGTWLSREQAVAVMGAISGYATLHRESSEQIAGLTATVSAYRAYIRELCAVINDLLIANGEFFSAFGSLAQPVGTLVREIELFGLQKKELEKHAGERNALKHMLDLKELEMERVKQRVASDDSAKSAKVDMLTLKLEAEVKQLKNEHSVAMRGLSDKLSVEKGVADRARKDLGEKTRDLEKRTRELSQANADTVKNAHEVTRLTGLLADERRAGADLKRELAELKKRGTGGDRDDRRKRKIEALEEELAEQKALVAARDRDLRRAAEEAEKLEKKRVDQLAAGERERAAKISELAAATEKIAALERSSEEVNRSARQLSQDLAAVSGARDEAVRAARDKLSEAAAREARLAAEAGELRKRVSQLNDRARADSETLAEARRAAAEDLVASSDAAKRALESLRAQYANTLSELTTMKEERQVKEATLRRVMEERHEALDTAAHLRAAAAESESLRARVAELEVELETLRAQMVTVGEERRAEEETLRRSVDAHHGARQAIERLEARLRELADLGEEVGGLRTQLAAREREMGELEAQLAARGMEVSSLKAQLASTSSSTGPGPDVADRRALRRADPLAAKRSRGAHQYEMRYKNVERILKNIVVTRGVPQGDRESSLESIERYIDALVSRLRDRDASNNHTPLDQDSFWYAAPADPPPGPDSRVEDPESREGRRKRRLHFDSKKKIKLSDVLRAALKRAQPPPSRAMTMVTLLGEVSANYPQLGTIESRSHPYAIGYDDARPHDVSFFNKIEKVVYTTNPDNAPLGYRVHTLPWKGVILMMIYHKHSPANIPPIEDFSEANVDWFYAYDSNTFTL